MEVLTIVAILAGPIAAVVVTRLMDSKREDYRRRLDVFRMLMRYRRHYLAGDFVGSLNLVPIEFDSDKAVLENHRAMMAVVYNPAWQSEDRETRARLVDQLDEATTNLLDKMAKNLKIKIAQLDILRGAYAPQDWADRETLVRDTQRLLLDVLQGSRAIHVVTENPGEFSPSPSERQFGSIADALAERARREDKKP